MISHEGTFYLTVKSHETPLEKRTKIEPRFLAHLTPIASELLDLSFLSELQIFVAAPPVAHLVDLVLAFNVVVVVEQFKKRVEKILSDSILLWRLLKLLFKILQWRSWVGYLCFDFLFYLFIQIYSFSELLHFLLFPGSYSQWRATKTTPHSSSRRKAKPTPLVKRSAPVSLTFCFHYQTPVEKQKDAKFSADCMKFNANWIN